MQDCNQKEEAGLDAGESPCKLSAMPSICTQGMSGLYTERRIGRQLLFQDLPEGVDSTKLGCNYPSGSYNLQGVELVRAINSTSVRPVTLQISEGVFLLSSSWQAR